MPKIRVLVVDDHTLFRQGIVGLLESFSYKYLGAGWQDVVTVVVLILILLFKPSGLFAGQVRGVWER